MHGVIYASVCISICIFETKVVRSKESARWLTCPILSAMRLISQPAFLGTPVWKVLYVKTKIASNCFIIYINIFVLTKHVLSRVYARDAWTCPTLIAMTLICEYLVLESSILPSHQRSLFASVLSITTLIAHSRNK